VDHARRRSSSARANGLQKISIDLAPEISAERTSDLVALDDALNSLSALDPRKGKIVELRFFGGLSEEDTAEVLKISSKTVQREWNKAKAWLYYELTKTGGSSA
jgi:RNA polymerase sigma-70 factor, ECF subfamily